MAKVILDAGHGGNDPGVICDCRKEKDDNLRLALAVGDIIYRYRVQLGLFRLYNNAIDLQYQLLQQGFPAEILQQGNFFVVLVGNFCNLDDAAELERSLRGRRYDTFLIAV